VKILVCVKQVLVLDGLVLSEDGSDVVTRHQRAGLNEWDGFAIEEALRLRETHGGEVVAVTHGPSEAEGVLRRALAMGVDRGVRVEGAAADPFTIGEGLSRLAARLAPDLILCGAQSSDSAHAATGAVLAGLLGLPCVAVVRSVRVDPKENLADVCRELEGRMRDRLHVALPAVLTLQTGINEPRHPNLRALKQADRESIEVIEPKEVDPAYRVRRMFAPVPKSENKPLGADVSEAAEAVARLIRGGVA